MSATQAGNPSMPPDDRSAIQPLDDVTISRIAAGEVVERPASVVKEALENAIDAGARAIDVEIDQGGRRRIKIVDDGRGIPAAEVELAFERHATSKLRDARDLTRVDTLGFRGEALASIAAVSQVTMITRAAGEETGSRIRIDNGRRVERVELGAPVGTSLLVEHLFAALPARLAFLRSESAESGQVTEVVTRYALARPDLRIRLVRNGRAAFSSPGGGELRDALLAVFPADAAREMIELPRFETPAAAVGGFVSPPHLHRANRKGIALFVNGRWVQDARLSFAISQAYHTLIPQRRFPLAVVRLEIPPEQVDVNVHPAKTEVRLRDGSGVFKALQRAVRAAVIGEAPVAPAEDGARAWRASPWRPRPTRPDRAIEDRDAPEYRPGSAGPAAGYGGGPAEPDVGAAPRLESAADVGPRQPTLAPEPRRALPPLRLLGQVGQAFLAAEGPDGGLYLVDQHAAHERIMYERFLARSGPMAGQALLAPAAVELGPERRALVEEHAESFARLGFELEPFGEDAVLVRALPEVVSGPDPSALLRDVLDALDEGDRLVERAFEERLVRAVCKRATVKAGQALAPEEMRALLRDLEACASPHTCPHGRPTMLLLSREEIERRFGR